MMQPGFPTDALFALVAYGVGVVAAILPLHIIVASSWALVEAEAVSDQPYFWWSVHAALRRYVWQGDLVGIVERSLYVTALILGRLEFVAVWLTLKTIARSPRWTEEAAIKGRGLFNVFLVGNGLSIVFAAIGYGLALWIAGPSWLRDLRLATLAAVAVTVAFALICTWLLLLLRHKHNTLEGMEALPDEGFKVVVGRPRRRISPMPHA